MVRLKVRSKCTRLVCIKLLNCAHVSAMSMHALPSAFQVSGDNVVTASTAQERRGLQAAKSCQGQASARVSLQPQGWGCTHTARQRHSTSHNQPMRHKYIKDSTSPFCCAVPCTSARYPGSTYTRGQHAQQPLPSVSYCQHGSGCMKATMSCTHLPHTQKEWTATEWMQQCNDGVVGHKKNAAHNADTDIRPLTDLRAARAAHSVPQN